MVENKFNQSWLHNHINDLHVKLAQREDYRAHAAYRLKEINEQDKLIRPGRVIVDLGAASGNWDQYVCNELAASPCAKDGRIDGAIVAIDILPMEVIADVTFIQGDFREDDIFQQLEKIVLEATGGGKADLVLSDMAPNLSGVASADAARTKHIAELTMEFVMAYLKSEGALPIKYFRGSGYSQIIEISKCYLKIMVSCRPKASHDKSSGIFLLGRQLKHSG